MDDYHRILSGLSSPELENPSAKLGFPYIKLPKIPELAEISLSFPQESPGRASILPSELDLPAKRRGAPTKLRNDLAEIYDFRNLKGKPFKFSFVSQILVAHLQHLFGLKGKSRYNKDKWLRSHLEEGIAMQRLIEGMVGDRTHWISFKRSVSMKDLKNWLCTTNAFDSEALAKSQLRTKVFRAFCVLKCIDIKNLCSLDFNVRSDQSCCGNVFRTYLLKNLWEELELPAITETEVLETLKQANNYLS